MRGRPAVRPSTPGNHVAGLATDQRGDGYPRVSGIAADIGAFEVQPEPLAPVIAKGFAPSSIDAGGTSRLTITLLNGNADAAISGADLADVLPGPVVVAEPPMHRRPATTAASTPPPAPRPRPPAPAPPSTRSQAARSPSR